MTEFLPGWTFHTVANALPAGILAWQVHYSRAEDVIAMAGVVALFVVSAPHTPLWPLYCGKGDWSRAFRAALWVRSVYSLLLVPVLLSKGGLFSLFAIVERLVGISCHHALAGVLRASGLRTFPVPGWIMTALITLLTGMCLLMVAGVLTLFVKGCVFRTESRREAQRGRLEY